MTEGGEYEFVIPNLPPSVNSLYNIIHAQRRIYLKPEARKWKTDAKLFMPVLACEGWETASIALYLHGNWYFKNGNRRKIDLQNLEKLIIDAVSEKAGICDSVFFSKHSRKIQDEKEEVRVKIRCLKLK